MGKVLAFNILFLESWFSPYYFTAGQRPLSTTYSLYYIEYVGKGLELNPRHCFTEGWQIISLQLLTKINKIKNFPTTININSFYLVSLVKTHMGVSFYISFIKDITSIWYVKGCSKHKPKNNTVFKSSRVNNFKLLLRHRSTIFFYGSIKVSNISKKKFAFNKIKNSSFYGNLLMRRPCLEIYRFMLRLRRECGIVLLQPLRFLVLW